MKHYHIDKITDKMLNYTWKDLLLLKKLYLILFKNQLVAQKSNPAQL